MPIKFLLLGGVLGFFRRGGVEVPILFFWGVGIVPRVRGNTIRATGPRVFEMKIFPERASENLQEVHW